MKIVELVAKAQVKSKPETKIKKKKKLTFMVFKFKQTQIFFGVITLTLGIIAGAIGIGYLLGHDSSQKIQTVTNPKAKPALSSENIAPTQAQPSTLKPPIETKSSATTDVTLTISESETQDKKTEVETSIPPSTQTLKNLKITLDKIEYTSTTPFKDPNSRIRDDETFVLLSVTLENISQKTLNLDSRAYLIEIFKEQIQNPDGKSEPKQVVYKPAQELGPTFSQSKSTLIRSNLSPNQKFSGIVGFKIPKGAEALNFYYPDVIGSTDIALFKIR